MSSFGSFKASDAIESKNVPLIRGGPVQSSTRLSHLPNLTLTFRDASRGFAVLSAKEGQDAFLSALRDEDLVISGDFVEVMWFQRLTDFLKPKTEAAH
jgi:hypothetical protein